MTKVQLQRLRFLAKAMDDHLVEWRPLERQFRAILGELLAHLGRVDQEPRKWGIK